MHHQYRTSTAVIVALGAALGLGAADIGAGANASEATRGVVGEAAGTAPVLPFEDIVAKSKAAGYTEIIKIERERGRYEVKARNKQGVIVEVYIDPASGEFVLDPKTGKPLTVTVGRSFKAEPNVPLEHIIAQVKAAGYAEVYSIEQEHALYEVKVRDSQGRRFELYVHPQTGEILKHPKTGEPLAQDIED